MSATVGGALALTVSIDMDVVAASVPAVQLDDLLWSSRLLDVTAAGALA